MRISGVVLIAGQSRGELAEVTLRPQGSGGPLVTMATDDEGRFSTEFVLPAGATYVLASAQSARSALRSAQIDVDCTGATVGAVASGFCVLRLVPTCVVRGRVIDEGGRGLARMRVVVDNEWNGAREENWEQDFVFGDLTECTTEDDGRFVAVMRSGGVGRCVVAHPDSRFAVRREFLCDHPTLDLGDIRVEAESKLGVWRITVRSAGGEVVEHPVLRLERRGEAIGRFSAGFDPARYHVLGKAGSFPDLTFVAEVGAPLHIAIAAPGHETLSALMPVDSPGVHAAVVTLTPMRRLVLHVRSADGLAESLKEARVRVEFAPSGAEPAAAAVDLLGRPASVPFAGGEATPAKMLALPPESSLPASTGEVVVGVPGGATEARVTVTVSDVVVHATRIALQDASEQREELRVPAGRVVWLRRADDTSGRTACAVQEVIAWVSAANSPADKGGVPLSAQPVPAGAPLPVWVPGDGSRLEFARAEIGVHRNWHVVGDIAQSIVRRDDAGRWCADLSLPPLGADQATEVVVELRNGGNRIETSGIPIEVCRITAPRSARSRESTPSGRASVRTGADGRARFLLPPGSFAVAPDSSFAAVPADVSAWMRIDVTGQGRMELSLPVEWK